MTDQAADSMIVNVRASTTAAVDALEQFRLSLVRARFAESAEVYRSMCDTLLGQRIWTLDKDDDQVERNFQRLREEAAEIRALLEPYLKSFEKLEQVPVDTELEDIEVSPPASRSVDEREPRGRPGAESLVIEALSKGRRNTLSMTRLRTSLGMPRKELEALLSDLSARQRIAIETSGSRKMIRLL